MVQRAVVGLTAAGWFAAVIVGFTALEAVDTTPGDAGPSTGAPAPAATWSLVMYVHPKCPCTRTSLGELQEVLAQASKSVRAKVVFVCPPGTSPGWERTDLWAMASDIPGVEVVMENGSDARDDGAATSGHTLLYSPNGRLSFHGGLTPGRGRAGEGPARRAILDRIRGDVETTDVAPVFGCPLFAQAACTDEGTGQCPR